MTGIFKQNICNTTRGHALWRDCLQMFSSSRLGGLEEEKSGHVICGMWFVANIIYFTLRISPCKSSDGTPKPEKTDGKEPGEMHLFSPTEIYFYLWIHRTKFTKPIFKSVQMISENWNEGEIAKLRQLRCVDRVFHGYGNTHGDQVTGTTGTGTVWISAYCGIPCTRITVVRVWWI